MGRCTDSEPHAIVPKESGLRTAIAAEIEIHICTVLVGASEAILGAQRVSLLGAQIVDHDDNACSSIAQRVARRVSLAGDLPTSATSRAGAGTGTHAIEVLTHGSTEAWVGVEGASSCVGVAVG